MINKSKEILGRHHRGQAPVQSLGKRGLSPPPQKSPYPAVPPPQEKIRWSWSRSWSQAPAVQRSGCKSSSSCSNYTRREKTIETKTTETKKILNRHHHGEATAVQRSGGKWQWQWQQKRSRGNTDKGRRRRYRGGERQNRRRRGRRVRARGDESGRPNGRYKVELGELLFSQESCKEEFRCGRSVADLVQELLDRKVSLSGPFCG